MVAVQENECALQYADDTLRANEKIVMAAVQHYGRALKYADATLKSNENIVMAAVQRNGYALEFADVTLTSTEEFIANCLFVHRENKENCEIIWEYTDEKIKEKYEGIWQNLVCSLYIKG
jgi:hypothetical protein